MKCQPKAITFAKNTFLVIILLFFDKQDIVVPKLLDCFSCMCQVIWTYLSEYEWVSH